MKSELSFLVSLLLEHKLTVATKKAVQARIVEVEQSMQQSPSPRISNAPGHSNTYVPAYPPQSGPQTQVTNQQSPSTLALMAKHGLLPPTSVVPAEAPQQLEQVLQQPQQPAEAPVINPAAISQALAARQALINEKLSDPEGKRSKRMSGLKVGMRD